MEEPHARVVATEADDKVPLRTHHEDVALHGNLWDRNRRIGIIRRGCIPAGVIFGACEDLESMSAVREGMSMNGQLGRCWEQ